MSSAEALYGVPLVLPGQVQKKPDILVSGAPPAETSPGALHLRQRSYADVAAGRNSILNGATFVYIRRGAVGTLLTDSYSGPYEVLQQEDKVLLLQIDDRQEWESADRLKPHLGAAPTPVQSPKRGRPTGVSRGVGLP